MGASFAFPDLNEPVIRLDSRLPPITRWVVITTIIALIVWAIFYALDYGKHSGHKKECAKLKRRLDALTRRFDEHFPPTPSS